MIKVNYMNIVEYHTQYYTNIDEATSEQQECYKQIEAAIDRGEYVDVGDNSYLYAYINKKLATPEEYISRYDPFIKLYRDTYPKETNYVYFQIFWAKLYSGVDPSTLIDEFNEYLEFLKKNLDILNNNYSRDGLASIYIIINNPKSDTPVDLKYFELFFGSVNEYVSGAVKEDIEEVRKCAYEILREDYGVNHVNYLYRLFDVLPGSIYLFMRRFDHFHPDPYINSFSFIDDEYLDSPSPHQDLGKTFREYYEKMEEYHVDGFIGARYAPRVDKKSKTFIKALYRLADNRYRIRNDLPSVGEGWVSESLLFNQIKSAFPKYTVLQHASPEFLGMQHYDVYLPDYKIALEYQGDQHFKPVDYFGGGRSV